jgi:hypothetical protein
MKFRAISRPMTTIAMMAMSQGMKVGRWDFGSSGLGCCLGFPSLRFLAIVGWQYNSSRPSASYDEPR